MRNCLSTAETFPLCSALGWAGLDWTSPLHRMYESCETHRRRGNYAAFDTKRQKPGGTKPRHQNNIYSRHGRENRDDNHCPGRMQCNLILHYYDVIPISSPCLVPEVLTSRNKDTEAALRNSLTQLGKASSLFLSLLPFELKTIEQHMIWIIHVSEKGNRASRSHPHKQLAFIPLPSVFLLSTSKRITIPLFHVFSHRSICPLYQKQIFKCCSAFDYQMEGITA